jgi:ribosomal protein S27E
MQVAEIRCLDCGETAYYSGRTKTLLCEGCGKEIAVAAEAIAALRTST